MRLHQQRRRGKENGLAVKTENMARNSEDKTWLTTDKASKNVQVLLPKIHDISLSTHEIEAMIKKMENTPLKTYEPLNNPKETPSFSTPNIDNFATLLAIEENVIEEKDDVMDDDDDVTGPLTVQCYICQKVFDSENEIVKHFDKHTL